MLFAAMRALFARHCEGSDAIHRAAKQEVGLLGRFAHRHDG
jgi:hypothetical protein